jgi:hypothetical protein
MSLVVFLVGVIVLLVVVVCVMGVIIRRQREEIKKIKDAKILAGIVAQTAIDNDIG